MFDFMFRESKADSIRVDKDKNSWTIYLYRKNYDDQCYTVTKPKIKNQTVALLMALDYIKKSIREAGSNWVKKSKKRS